MSEQMMKTWHKEAIALHLQKGLSGRKIAELLDRSKSQVNDVIRAYKDAQDMQGVTEPPKEFAITPPKNNPDVFRIITSKDTPEDCTHLVIPDTQVKRGVCLNHLKALGQYIVDKQPDVIVHLGDHADMESLSSYDKGKRSAEGKRVQEDIDAAINGLKVLLQPLYDLQQEQLEEYGEVLYTPKLLITLGNHEFRIHRHVDANPELHGFLSYDNLRYKDFGFEVYDFLDPVIVDGVTYVHFMANPMSGKPYGGAALNVLKNVGESFTQGHKQTLDVATRFLPSSGKQQWAIIAGSFYSHDEEYKGYQGNHHWRGIIVKHNVKDGSFNPMFVSLDYLMDRYGYKVGG